MNQLLLLAALLPTAPIDDAWSPSVQQHIAQVATRLMPPALGRQLTQYSGELKAGARAPFEADEPREYHTLHADGEKGRIDQRVEQQITKLVTMLNNRAPFRDVVYELGVTSHYVADAAWPLATSDQDPMESVYAADLAHYVERNLKKFPPVFDGYFPFNDRPFLPADYLRTIAERANMHYPLIHRCYFPDGAAQPTSSRSFDDRHPAFGVAQLAFNHAVSAVANIWLFVWREAHGDMGDAGATSPGWRPRETDSSRAAQRP